MTGMPPGTLGLLARRPSLWPVAVRLVPRRWWRRWPPLPWPPPAYARFRLETMCGEGGRLTAEEVIAYLEWCRRTARPAR